MAAGDNTSDLAVDQILLHGATIQDLSGNDAALPLSPINPAGTLQIDTLAPSVLLLTADPSSGIAGFGQSISIDVVFGEAVTLAGGTPTLSLNDNGTATYDAAATAALHDPTKLVFDYTVGPGDTIVPTLAVTGIDLHGAAIDDLAGNAADLGNIATTFSHLGANASLMERAGCVRFQLRQQRQRTRRQPRAEQQQRCRRDLGERAALGGVHGRKFGAGQLASRRRRRLRRQRQGRHSLDQRQTAGSRSGTTA